MGGGGAVNMDVDIDGGGVYGWRYQWRRSVWMESINGGGVCGWRYGYRWRYGWRYRWRCMDVETDGGGDVDVD